MQTLAPIMLPSWLLAFYQNAPFSCFFPLYSLIACVGLFFFMGPYLAKKKKRTSYEKGARQLCLLSTVLGWLLLIGGKICLYLKHGTWFPETLFGFLLEIAWLMLCVTVLLITLHRILWKPLVNHPFFLSLLSFMTFFQGLASALLLLFLFRMEKMGIPASLSELPHALELLGNDLLEGGMPAIVGGLPLLIAMPAVFGSLGLLCLRRVHDYGRDHYSVVLTWFMQWTARFGFLLFFFCGIALAYQLSPYRDSLLADPLSVLSPFAPLLLFCSVWFLASILLKAISASELPLRHKALMVFCDFLLLCSIPLFAEILLR
ncbi:MAG: hypothetical protein J5803_03580 [Desulfovibrio sp.]|nr:hypothetical protein [Desulfovibrio sp.]